MFGNSDPYYTHEIMYECPLCGSEIRGTFQYLSDDLNFTAEGTFRHVEAMDSKCKDLFDFIVASEEDSLRRYMQRAIQPISQDLHG